MRRGNGGCFRHGRATVAHPIGRVHLEEFEWVNLLQVVDASNRIVRTINVAGNPTISKPDVCYATGRIRVNCG